MSDWRPPPDGGPPQGRPSPSGRRIPSSGLPERDVAAGTGPASPFVPPTPRLTPEQLEADPSYGTRQRALVDPFPAWNPDVKEFYVQGNNGGTAVPANSTQFPLVSYAPSRNSVGYVKGFGQDGLCAAFQEVTWQLAIGGRVLQTFLPIAQVGSFLDEATMTWPFTGGNPIQILVTTGSNAFELAGMLHILEKNLDMRAPERF